MTSQSRTKLCYNNLAQHMPKWGPNSPWKTRQEPSGQTSAEAAYMPHWNAWVCFPALAPDSQPAARHTMPSCSDGSSDWAPDTHVEDRDCIPVSWLQPRPPRPNPGHLWALQKWARRGNISAPSLCLPIKLKKERKREKPTAENIHVNTEQNFLKS